MGMADERGILGVRRAGIQHRFQSPGRAFEKERSDLCHCSVYLLDYRGECSRLVPAGKKIEIVHLSELQQRMRRGGVSWDGPSSGFRCRQNSWDLLHRAADPFVRRKPYDESAALSSNDE